MPPVQNTFSIIPDLPSALNGNLDGRADGANARTSRPPMTSKQVKKAYQKANKGPKLSKAEQRRQELFEQDRIRKEFEKEKNQARARAARDKKKEREEKERAEKKKKGLPLVDVRPSQDTIARFVRAKPKSRQHDSASPLHGGERESRSLSPAHYHHDSSNSDQIPKFDYADDENEKIEKRPPPSPVVLVENRHGLGSQSPILGNDAEPLSKKRRITVSAEEGEDVLLTPIANEAVVLSPKLDLKVDSIGDHGKENIAPSLEQERAELDIDDSYSTIDLSEENLLQDLLHLKDIEEDPVSPPKVQPPTDSPKPRDIPRRSPKRLFTSTCRELRYKYAIERSRTAAWEGPAARQKAREELDRLQALEDERLEALLANPDEGLGGEKNDAAAVVTESCTTRLDIPGNKSPTTRPAAVQGSKPGLEGSNGGISKRNARPKGSYEAMLELLAKGPKQKPDLGTKSAEKENAARPKKLGSGLSSTRGGGGPVAPLVLFYSILCSISVFLVILLLYTISGFLFF
ncbi:hypothetical protein ONZ43_g477 [Nemania bipapillata]|uniref:Uncharacterized protein n=1 Tax=Nemania bipapillata TaxID=110536 RepID=A0ACC2J800_9PEZI|nr:hypothetical protein ONZ43_g477 [Nemania bipapillata]